LKRLVTVVAEQTLLGTPDAGSIAGDAGRKKAPDAQPAGTSGLFGANQTAPSSRG
jgi:hypothetical protein